MNRRPSATLIFLLAFLLPGVVLAQDKPTLKDRFADVKEWDFAWVYTSNSPYRWTELGGISYNRATLQQSSSGRIRITTRTVGDVLQLEGVGGSSSSYHKHFVESSQYYSKRRTDKGSGNPEARVRVEMDLNRGVYTLEVLPGQFKCTYGGTDRNFNGAHTYGPSEEELSVEMPTLPTLDDGASRLPDGGTLIAGEYSFQQQIARMSKDPSFNEKEWSKRSPRSGTLRWILTPADVLDVKLIVEPQNYDQWMPEAGANESAAGNTIGIKARLVDKKTGGAPSIKARTMSYRLLGTSHEPGIAINAPLKDAKGTADLAFDPAGLKGWQFGNDNQEAVTPPGSYESSEAAVTSYDYGAYSTLLVTAELENGRVVVGELAGTSEFVVRLPKRGADSMIADKWKADLAFDGDDPDDKDKQKGNENPGDGLTAYEEYRGMLIKGAHTRADKRLDPSKKELVVENQIGDRVRPGIKLLETAAGLRVIELEKGALPDSRQVNVNFLTSHGGDQFGMRIVKDTLQNTVGENQPATQLGKTPKLSQRVVIDVDAADREYAQQEAVVKAGGLKMPFTAAEELANTVAHELAHGIHVAHHGKETDYKEKREVTERMRDWQVYSTAGVEMKPAEEPGGVVKLTGSIGRPGNTASGDSGCIMAYTNAYNWAAVGPIGGPYKFYAVGLQPVGNHFCISPKAAGFNVDHPGPGGMALPGFFGDATSVGQGLMAGNCLGQMKISDW